MRLLSFSIINGVEWLHHSHHTIGGMMTNFDFLLLALWGIGCLVMYILWKVGVFE